MKSVDQRLSRLGVQHTTYLALQETSPKPIIGQIVEVLKYFRKRHLPAAWLDEKPTSVKPELDSDEIRLIRLLQDSEELARVRQRWLFGA